MPEFTVNQELIQRYLHRKLAVFLGEYAVDTDKEALRLLRRALAQELELRTTTKQGDLQKDPRLMQYAETILGREETILIVRRHFRKSMYDTSDLHLELARLRGVQVFVTTCIDSRLEDALQKTGRDAHLITNRFHAVTLPPNPTRIYPIRGRLMHSNLYLAENLSASPLLSDHSVRSSLYGQLIDNTLLFIGFDHDDQLLRICEFLGRETSQDIFSRNSFAVGVNHGGSERQLLRQKYNVQLIDEDPTEWLRQFESMTRQGIEDYQLERQQSSHSGTNANLTDAEFIEKMVENEILVSRAYAMPVDRFDGITTAASQGIFAPSDNVARFFFERELKYWTFKKNRPFWLHQIDSTYSIDRFLTILADNPAQTIEGIVDEVYSVLEMAAFYELEDLHRFLIAMLNHSIIHRQAYVAQYIASKAQPRIVDDLLALWRVPSQGPSQQETIVQILLLINSEHSDRALCAIAHSMGKEHFEAFLSRIRYWVNSLPSPSPAKLAIRGIGFNHSTTKAAIQLAARIETTHISNELVNYANPTSRSYSRLASHLRRFLVALVSGITNSRTLRSDLEQLIAFGAPHLAVLLFISNLKSANARSAIVEVLIRRRTDWRWYWHVLGTIMLFAAVGFAYIGRLINAYFLSLLPMILITALFVLSLKPRGVTIFGRVLGSVEATITEMVDSSTNRRFLAAHTLVTGLATLGSILILLSRITSPLLGLFPWLLGTLFLFLYGLCVSLALTAHILRFWFPHRIRDANLVGLMVFEIDHFFWGTTRSLDFLVRQEVLRRVRE